MKTIKLYGHLSEWGSEHKLNVANPAMAVRALIGNFGTKFRNALREGHYRIVRGRLDVDQPDEVSEQELLVGTSADEIHFIPVVEGSGGFFRAVAGVVLIVVGVITQQPWLINMGASMALGGVAEMLTGTPKAGDYTKANVALNASFVFNGAVNTVAQGGPVPLVYGRFRVGSTVISAGLEVAQIGTADPTGQPLDGRTATPVITQPAEKPPREGS